MNEQTIVGAEATTEQALVAPLGVRGAIMVLQIFEEENYNRNQPVLNRLYIPGDDCSWARSGPDEPLADPIELLHRFGDASREDWIRCVNELFGTLSPDQRADFGPQVASGIAGEDEDTDDGPFPIHCLPPVFRRLCEARARIQGVAVEMHGTAAIGATAAALGKGVRIPTVCGLTTSPNLYLLIVARSGIGKTVNVGPFLAAAEQFERSVRAEHRTSTGRIRAEIELTKQQISQLQQNDIEDPTKREQQIEQLAVLENTQRVLEAKLEPPTILVENVTSEKLAMLMERNGVLFSASTDGRSVVQVLGGTYRGGVDDSFYVKAYSGDNDRQHRVSRASTQSDQPLLTILWCLQPDKFQQLFQNDELLEGGFLTRCLICLVPKPTSEKQYDAEGPVAEQADFDGLQIQLFRTYHQRSRDPVTISVSSEARKVLTEFHRTCDRQALEEESERVASFISRWGETAWRVALVFHCAEHGGNSHNVELSEATAESAVTITRWFAKKQQGQLRAAQSINENMRLSVALAFVNQSAGGVVAWNLHRKHQKLFPKPRDARDALDELQEEGSVTSQPWRSTRRFYRLKPPKL